MPSNNIATQVVVGCRSKIPGFQDTHSPPDRPTELIAQQAQLGKSLVTKALAFTTSTIVSCNFFHYLYRSVLQRWMHSKSKRACHELIEINNHLLDNKFDKETSNIRFP